ncbi:MAG: pentapeptide repeat-containing protein [Microcystaceae cyanobacterium]
MSIKKASLSYKNYNSDKVYEVEIVYVSWEQYHVNYAYGKTGTKLRTGKKTKNPVSLQEAEKIYDELVKSKENKGYRLTYYSTQINRDFLLECSLEDRQAIIDRLKRENAGSLLQQIKQAGIDPRDYLRGIDLSNANLTNADLRYCDLSQTNLCGANLTGAKLQGTHLEDSQIDETTQLEPKWRLVLELIKSGGENQDLRGVDLSDLAFYFDGDYEINLSGANLEGANLSQSNLYDVDFTNANLKSANLKRAELYYFSGANLEDANLSDAVLGEAYFDNSICINTNFSRVHCQDEFINFENVNCTGANFQEAVFSQGLISGANFTNANFTGVIGFEQFISGIEGSEITEEVRFTNANLSKIDISHCDYLTEIYGIELINWQGVRFDQANLENTDLSGFTFEAVSFRGANLKGAKLENCNLEGADFTGANLEGTNLKGVDISQVLSFQNITVNENTQVDEQWQDWLNQHQHNQSLQKNKKQTNPTEAVNLQKITIQTPKVNRNGKIIKTENYDIEYFTEILPNDVKLEMVYIVGGTFWMGEGDSVYNFRHQVTVPSFYMARYPITQEQWKVIAQLDAINRELTVKTAHFSGNKRPIENISWHDAIEFCQRLSQFTNKNYQLPSEAQWEYSCRAGTSTPFSFGETITENLANYQSPHSNVEETTTVGIFPPNRFGLYDMHGNVWEWCLDDWRSTYHGNEVTDGSAFIASHVFTEQKALRGGYFNAISGYCSSTFRSPEYPVIVSSSYGFRVQCN